jgi:ATP-dependent Clp protease ATP-binding subunit ClpC
MYQKLSETAKDVLEIAKAIAQREHQEYIGTEHILVAILEHNECIAAQILKNAQISADAVKQKLESINGNNKQEALVLGHLRGTPHFERAFHFAIEEAEAQNAKNIGTEHLLLGLLRQPDCPAQKALTALGLTLEIAQQKINP